MVLENAKKGQRVAYVAPYSKREEGVVSSRNAFYIFVKFDNAIMKMVSGDEPYIAKACRPEDLKVIENEGETINVSS